MIACFTIHIFYSDIFFMAIHAALHGLGRSCLGELDIPSAVYICSEKKLRFPDVSCFILTQARTVHLKVVELEPSEY